jgi:anti-anti-sigma factor
MLSVRIIDAQVPIVVVEGKINENNKNEIDEAIRLALAPRKNQLILDVTGVKSLDAGEAQAIVEATHRTLGRGGRLALVVSEKDENHALLEARVADIPGVFVFRDRKEAEGYFAERGLGII